MKSFDNFICVSPCTLDLLVITSCRLAPPSQITRGGHTRTNMISFLAAQERKLFGVSLLGYLPSLYRAEVKNAFIRQFRVPSGCHICTPVFITLVVH